MKIQKMIQSLIIITCIFFFNTDIYSQNQQKALATSISPYYKSLNNEGLPTGYISKNDTGIIQSVMLDSAGIPWFSIMTGGVCVFSPAKYWKYLSDADTSAYADGESNDSDKKRRLTILHDNPQWPRRIIRAVRTGRICLDMTSAQLIAAWGEPIQKSDAFAVGLGTHTIYFFQNSSEKLTSVLLKDDVVVGWSLKK